MNTKKVVVNKCYGGFSISENCILKIAELKKLNVFVSIGKFNLKTYWTVPEGNEKRIFAEKVQDNFYESSIEDRQKSNDIYKKYTIDNSPRDREDEFLIKAIESIGEKESSGEFSKLEIIKIPKNVEYEIDDYDGFETIREFHRSW